MPELNFLLENYCAKEAISFQLEFLVNFVIKIISSDAKNNTLYRRNFLPPIFVHSTGFLFLKS